MSGRRALAAAYAGCFLIGIAVGLVIVKHGTIGATVGAAGAILSISALIWILRRENRR